MLVRLFCLTESKLGNVVSNFVAPSAPSYHFVIFPKRVKSFIIILLNKTVTNKKKNYLFDQRGLEWI